MGLGPEDILHICLMPCYDKKLEAARPDFEHNKQQQQQQQQQQQHESSLCDSRFAFGVGGGTWSEVDIVLTTAELPLLLQ